MENKNINLEKEKDKISDSMVINEIKNNKNENNNNLDYEGLPILSQLEPVKTSLENFYKTNYPEFKIIKCFNFIFIKMGRLLAFNFDENRNYTPKYSIGPHWYLTLVLLILILFLGCLLYSTIFEELGFFKKLILILLLLVEYYFVFKTSLTHPKVVMNKKKTLLDNVYCNICKVYYNPKNKVEHCNFCKVCVEKMDHHCVWVGKCVAKNNAFYFYGMIVNICILYIYIIICGIFFAFTSK